MCSGVEQSSPGEMEDLGMMKGLLMDRWILVVMLQFPLTRLVTEDANCAVIHLIYCL